MIKLLPRRLPLDERKLLTIVVGVATGAGLAAGAFGHVAGVEAASGGNPAGDFAVTIQALERGLPAQAMTAGAVGCALQETVRAGEWAGRFVPKRTQRTTRGPQYRSRAAWPGCDATGSARRKWRSSLRVAVAIYRLAMEIRLWTVFWANYYISPPVAY